MVNTFKREDITQEILHEILDYNPLTGIFIWKKRTMKYHEKERDMKAWNTKYAGKYAGTEKNNNGRFYVYIKIFGINYRAHILAHMYMTGEKSNVIDHGDGNTLNNIFTNLKNGTTVDNCRNMKLFSNNTSGFCGVYKRKNKWHAQIVIEGKKVHIGTFHDIHEAAAARQKYNELYGFSARHGSAA